LKPGNHAELKARTGWAPLHHSLRYAFITYMLRRGMSSSIIAAVTGHKNLNMILKYTERKEAEKLLEELERMT
jgi:integrase